MRNFLSMTIATAFGAGLAPKAPGTFGTLVGLIPVFFLIGTSPWIRVGVWLFLFVLGVWAARQVESRSGRADDQRIVIDEVVGVGITAFSVTAHWPSLLVAFVVFRFFDILKIPPVRQLDSWSKKGAPSGLGAMIDDVGAGFQGLVVLLLLQRFGILP